MGESVTDLKISTAERNVELLKQDTSGLISEKEILENISRLNQSVVSDLRLRGKIQNENADVLRNLRGLEREKNEAIMRGAMGLANQLQNRIDESAEARNSLEIIQRRIDNDQELIKNQEDLLRRHQDLNEAEKELSDLLEIRNGKEVEVVEVLKVQSKFTQDMLLTEKGRNDAAIVLLDTEEKMEILRANRVVGLMQEDKIRSEQNQKLQKDAQTFINQNSMMMQAELGLQEAKGQINEFEKERLVLEQELATARANKVIGTINEIELLTEEIKIKTRLSLLDKKINEERLKEFKRQASLASQVAQQLARDEKTKKRIAFAEAMVNVVAASVATFKKVSEIALPPIPAAAAASQFILGSAMASEILKFEQGGLVGGRRHNQGGTIIEAERGEYVMSRNAVDSIGVNNLDAMNEGGAGTSIVINNPIISSEFVETELPELIAEAVRKGADFGMS